MQTILVIDDHEEFREIVSSILFAEDFDVLEASCPDEAFPLLMRDKPDLIICDLFMPFTTDHKSMSDYQYSYTVGVKTLEELSWAIPEVPLIVTSAAVPTDIRNATAHLPMVTILPKPFPGHKLLSITHHLLSKTADMAVN